MWKKMLKLRDLAKTFHMKAIRNGRHTSFWYDRWSELGVMSDLLGGGGIIDMGIRRNATVEEAIKNQRRKSRHRRALVNDIKRELDSIKGKQNVALDNVDLWRVNSGFKPKFLTHETWMLSRETKAQCTWARSIWFSEATQSLLS